VADCIVGLAPTDPKAELAGPHCSLICILLRKLRVVKVASGGIQEAPQTHPHEVKKLEYVLGHKAAESDCQSSLCVQSCATQTDIVVLRSLHTHQALTSTSSQSSCAAHGAKKRSLEMEKQ